VKNKQNDQKGKFGRTERLQPDIGEICLGQFVFAKEEIDIFLLQTKLKRLDQKKDLD
jgi:hypothetical protein